MRLLGVYDGTYVKLADTPTVGAPGKAAAVADTGTFAGYASFFGFLDRQGEIVDQGAFTRCLPTFRKAGLITWAHDTTRPVSTIVSAVEDQFGLFITAKFHSTPDAQNARTIVLERLAAGADVGLSIGYGTVKDRYVGSTKHLADLELYEVGIVMVPANTLATVTSAKGRQVGPAIPLTMTPAKARQAALRQSVAANEAALARLGAGPTLGPHRTAIAMAVARARSLGVPV
jgi:hypothetical protein